MISVCQEQNTDCAIEVLRKIPELAEPIEKQNLTGRLKTDPIILVAYSGATAVGVKIGYCRYNDGSFYSWLGGVLPAYRNKGIAQRLNQKMEQMARDKGYTSMVLKTRNKFKPMLHFALKNGYSIVGFQEKDSILEHRILLSKKL
ncbi:GNAT family N-acetyltransferase [uncultured Draconibacterium sp.]|uniref:GNAT family N-acetyltransferase n=1 Tax=uncultured Draconibacterium sp. TaxID=1573823 RepID=UPI003260150C